MKHLKTLGLAAMAVLALTAMVGVSSASAAEFHGTGGTALTGVVGENNHVFTIEGSTVTCNTIAFNGTAAASGTSVTQTMHPSYSNCTAFGFINAVINTSNCLYEFNANTNTVNLTSCTSPINIVAESGFGTCKATVGNQNGINGQTFINMGVTNPINNKNEQLSTLTENSSANNIITNVNTSNGICPINTGTKNTAEYDGNTGIMGATGGTHVN
jgi:hypothetical protein